VVPRTSAVDRPEARAHELHPLDPAVVGEVEVAALLDEVQPR